jgi:CubicO group peptidase (beta-lactamase class C family)
MAEQVQGTCDARFEAVRDAFTGNFASGKDVGASVAVVHDGELVVDLWGGYADEAGTTPWERDTIINVWSTTKTMAALCMLMLVDRGQVDLDAPVATYWPEFAAAGKENVLVRHVLGHTAGLAGWTAPMDAEDLYDWDLAVGRLAEQATLWEPGTASGYHAVTQGFLEGEIVRRVTGSTIGQFFAKEVAGPLGADFHIGTPPECDDRVALVIPPSGLTMPETMPPMALALMNPPLSAAQSWEIRWRGA